LLRGHVRPRAALAVTALLVYLNLGALNHCCCQVSTMAEEVKNPARDMPLGIISCITFVTIIYGVCAARATKRQRRRLGRRRRARGGRGSALPQSHAQRRAPSGPRAMRSHAPPALPLPPTAPSTPAPPPKLCPPHVHAVLMGLSLVLMVPYSKIDPQAAFAAAFELAGMPWMR
jgi:hypothetical protein